MHGAECTEWLLEESWRKVAEGSIHYYNHFTSLEKVALRAAAVKGRRRKRQEREEEEEERRGGEICGEKSLSWLLVNPKCNFIFQPLLLSHMSTQSTHTISKDIPVAYHCPLRASVISLSYPETSVFNNGN